MVWDGWHWHEVACHRTTTASVSSVKLASERLFLKKSQRKLWKKCRIHPVGLRIKFAVMLDTNGYFIWSNISLSYKNATLPSVTKQQKTCVYEVWFISSSFHDFCTFLSIIASLWQTVRKWFVQVKVVIISYNSLDMSSDWINLTILCLAKWDSYSKRSTNEPRLF